MDTGSHRFKTGDFECIALADGTNTYMVSNLFVNAPEDHLQQALNEHHLQPEQLEIPYTCLAVNADRHWVLIDTGMGTSSTPNVGKLLYNLRAAGIEPTDIDTVILTHGHGDHIGGCTDSAGNPTFPQARYVMWKEEWNLWTSEENLVQMGREHLIPFIQNTLLPIQGQLDLIDRETEIRSGIRIIHAPGHTPGHLVVLISSAGEHMLYASDALIHPILLEHPDWHSVYDLNPKDAAVTMQRLLDQASAENYLVHAFHFPFPGLGYVTRKEAGWQWKPIEV